MSLTYMDVGIKLTVSTVFFVYPLLSLPSAEQLLTINKALGFNLKKLINNASPDRGSTKRVKADQDDYGNFLYSKTMKCGTKVLAFFSGFYPLAPFHISKFLVDGIKYWSVQQYIAEQGARLFKDKKTRIALRQQGWKPTEAVSLFHKIVDFKEEDWKEVEQDVVENGLREKFQQNPVALSVLLDTKDQRIVFASTFDFILGCGHFVDDLEQMNWCDFIGENVIGAALEKVREEFKRGQSED